MIHAKQNLPMRNTMVGKITKLIVDLLLYSVPGKPEVGKWTKDPPAVDWFTCVQTLLPFRQMVHNAYHNIKVTISTDANPSELSFQEMTGVREDHNLNQRRTFQNPKSKVQQMLVSQKYMLMQQEYILSLQEYILKSNNRKFKFL